MSNYLVTFYTKPDGSKPVSEFIQSLEPKMQAKVIRSLEILEANGPTLREPYAKALGDGILNCGYKPPATSAECSIFMFWGILLSQRTDLSRKRGRRRPPSFGWQRHIAPII